MKRLLAVFAFVLLSLGYGVTALANEILHPLPIPSPTHASTLQPVRFARLRFAVSQSTYTKKVGAQNLTNQKYAEVCRGEVEIPVYDLLAHKNGSYSTKAIDCEAQTGRGPMELSFYASSVLRNDFSMFDKSFTPVKELDISMSLFDSTPTGKVPYVYEFYNTHTADLAQQEMNFRAQSTPVHTAIEGGELQDEFFIRFELMDEQ